MYHFKPPPLLDLWMVFYLYMFSKLVCRAIWEGFLFTVIVSATIFLITFRQQWKGRFSSAALKSSGRGGKRSMWDRTSVPSTCAFSREPAHTHARRHACAPRLRQRHWKVRTSEEEWAREMNTTSLFGPVWDSWHRKPAADWHAPHSRPDNRVMGGMPSCLCGRRVSSPSIRNSSCDSPKLCRFNPRHH